MKSTFFLLPVIGLAAFLHSPVYRLINPALIVIAEAKPASVTRFDDPLVTDVLTYTNKARAKKGLKPLVMKDGLNDIAHGHSENMAKGKVPFSHDGFKERYAKAREVYSGISSFGENVSFGPHDGKEAVDQWMGSQHHKDNILGDFTSIGIGVAADKKGMLYFTQVFCKE